MHQALGVEALYLEEAFKVMREQSGSLDNYMEQVLGLTPAMRAKIEARLIA